MLNPNCPINQSRWTAQVDWSSHSTEKILRGCKSLTANKLSGNHSLRPGMTGKSRIMWPLLTHSAQSPIFKKTRSWREREAAAAPLCSISSHILAVNLPNLAHNLKVCSEKLHFKPWRNCWLIDAGASSPWIHFSYRSALHFLFYLNKTYRIPQVTHCWDLGVGAIAKNMLLLGDGNSLKALAGSHIDLISGVKVKII